jgi:hypothetical protein
MTRQSNAAPRPLAVICLLDTRNLIKWNQQTSCSFVLGALGLLGVLELGALEGSELRETEGDGVSRELLVAVGHGLKAGAHKVLVKSIEEDGLVALALAGDADLATVDVGGSHDILKGGGVDGLESAGTGALLGNVVHSAGGDDGAVSNEHHGPLELGFHKLNNLVANLAESGEGAEGDADQVVLGHGAIVLGELNLGDGVDVDELELGAELGVLNLEVGEGLGKDFLKVGDLLVVLLDNLGLVEHWSVFY